MCWYALLMLTLRINTETDHKCLHYRSFRSVLEKNSSTCKDFQCVLAPRLEKVENIFCHKNLRKVVLHRESLCQLLTK